MSNSFDILSKLLGELALVHEKANYKEIDTRAKLIDPLFIKGLGWTENDIERDYSTNPGFADYVFSINGVPKFVVESKRSGLYFELPDSLSTNRYELSGLLIDKEPLAMAVEQVQKYCGDTGVRYGVATNGHQYLVFQAIKYGERWKKKKCLLFYGIAWWQNSVLGRTTVFSLVGAAVT